ncbi:hypothetical protein [Candidatus Neoehrlichia procyonis]|uniref:Uncharacterized protein n=1 Tax=Candidatus Neoehrlichia procyonis str. RAC413 TaxID=1359163 RepID=A0A0F3NMI0_9RICK|nr:hypothetical protein [Candidatus Neoehrlichia lotoris]KJV69268.1 hypothetical protein NLO413_0651 [Candidatus Neoehrlichia lotoris str. RAC413]
MTDSQHSNFESHKHEINTKISPTNKLYADIFLDNIDLEQISINNYQYEFQNKDLYIVFDNPQNLQESLSDDIIFTSNNQSANVRILFDDHKITLDNVKMLTCILDLHENYLYAEVELPTQDYKFDEKPFIEKISIPYHSSHITIDYTFSF